MRACQAWLVLSCVCLSRTGNPSTSRISMQREGHPRSWSSPDHRNSSVSQIIGAHCSKPGGLSELFWRNKEPVEISDPMQSFTNTKSARSQCSCGPADHSATRLANQEDESVRSSWTWRESRNAWGDELESANSSSGPNVVRLDALGMPSRDLDALDDQASVSGHREQQQYELSPAEFFVHELMIPEDQIEGIFRRCPQLTSLSVNKNLRPAVLALTSRGLSKAHVARALLIGPSLLSRHVTLNSGRVLDLFLDLGVRSAKLGKVVAARPEVLSLSVSKNLCTKISFLCDELMVDRGQIGKMIESCPSMLTMSLEKHMRPTCTFLERIGIPAHKIGNLIRSFPQILCFSISRKLVPNVEYLVNVVGVPEEKIGTVLMKKPQIFGYVTDKMQRTISFFREEVGMTSEQMRVMVMRFPALLGYSVEMNLRPTLSFLRGVLGVSMQHFARDLVSFPQMLSYSLERRVKPRLQHMRDLGVDLTSKDMSIASLLRRTDSSFCRRHGVLQPQSKPILDAGVDESRLVLSTSTGLDQNSMNIPAAGTRLWSRA